LKRRAVQNGAVDAHV